ncbi:MAG: tyrosine-type recombinase/integrase [Anaeroplasmataceae bacterium]|nr:tyrosine-type recombinase/integrase [Anaeroplasmataceae bacterium]
MAAFRLQRELQVITTDEREHLLEQLGREIDCCVEVQSTYRRKVKNFLAERGIWHIAEIDIKVRVDYQNYLKKDISEAARCIYMTAFDRIKRHSVREQVKTLKGKKDALADLDKQIIFLPYHPDQEIADQFVKFIKVDNLIWDFSQKAPVVMKRQIFDVLHFMLRQHMKVSDRSSNLSALKRLYEFCIKEQVQDIESIEQKQVNKFQDSIQYKREREYAMRILDQCRKILFIDADEIHWNANIWYLERFHFEKARTNPTSPVKTFSFFEIEDRNNRKHLQQYMKYCLGVTHLTIGVIRSEFTHVRNFLVWLEKMEPQDVRRITEDTIKRYFKYRDQPDIQEETFNRMIISILHFFDYLRVRGMIEKVPFCEKYYLKKTVSKHHDRSVETEIYTEILAKLQYFPEELRLMFLHLWGIGLRASEVCSLKGNAYYIQGRDAWIQVYQIKKKDYKRIPIPWAIYKLMEVYLEKYQIDPEDYIFQNKKGGAYYYASFRYRMQKWGEKIQVKNGEYLFKSHDYRHTVATMYYENGVSIQSVRDYLGHDYEEMTQQYIDYMPKKISRANEEYFEQEENGLASGIQRCKRGK